MIKFFLVVLFIIHLLNIFDIKSGGIQIITLTWCGLLLIFPSLNAKPFIFLVTLMYSFTFSVLLWVYDKTGKSTLQLPLITQGLLFLLGLMALIS